MFKPGKAFETAKALIKDPFGVDKDWDGFAKMSDSDIKKEWLSMLSRKPKSARFRRLCHYVSMRWVFADNGGRRNVGE